jgi:NADPH-dependent curcumin reductase CurA
MALIETISIHGIVIPAAWNEKGEVISVAIATYNEDKYLVEDNIKGRQLLSLIRKRVVVKGILRRRITNNVIEVDSFQEDKSRVKEKHTHS